MVLHISVVQEDIARVSADLLLLKHAQSFYGADQAVAIRLMEQRACAESEIAPPDGSSALVESCGAVAAARVLFLGVPRLSGFRYPEMRQFARRAIEFIADRKLPVRTLATTVHGAGYGLDIEESAQSMILGFQQGLTTNPLPDLERLIFVERNGRRFDVLRRLLANVELVMPAYAVSTQPPKTIARAEAEAARKKSVFVAMPFTEDCEDVYQFGIYNVVRRCGYVCEKVDESAFAGSIIDRIMEGIRNASFVVADLTLERPNVYLEVGYAWGLGRPVILVAKEGQKLHFDLSHHKCLFYRTIGKLGEALEKTVLEMFGRGTDRGE